ncbi:MAG: hypothetical protein QM708_11550 [Propioniciclava sp.]|uniref:hypothetical protein n=1 Tax=Propioniciclava sp. TaxID=2038686 RepID=UPI0039E601B2
MTTTKTPRTPVRVATRIAAALLLTAGFLLPGAVAVALPPDGAGPDTKGTKSRVWPAQVKVGDRLNFEVSGYPANEVVYIKIDDGLACSDTSHGACVYATQKLDRNGRATGSIVVPQLAPGKHWLRMLATGDVFDAKTGEKLGYDGYTRRGGNDFTVVAGGAATGGGSTGAGAGTQAGGGTTAQQGGAGTTSNGTVAGGSVSLGEPSQDGGAGQQTATAAPVATTETPDAVAVSSTDGAGTNGVQPEAASSSVPVVGIAVLGGSVVLGGGALAWALVHRRRMAAAASGEQA